MKVAIIFKGISYASYHHWCGNYVHIDFRDNIRNLQRTLINPLKCDNNVDIFCVTYEHKNLHLLFHELEPKVKKIIPSEQLYRKNHTYVIDMILEGLNLIGSDTYDLVIVTRYDINLTMDITNIPYQPDKINFLCKAKGCDPQITYNDDTIFVFHGSRTHAFKEAVLNLVNMETLLAHHLIYNTLVEKGYEDCINFMYPELYEISQNRPCCLFNREINYRPEALIVSALPRIVGIRFRRGNSTLEYIDNGMFILFKPDGEELTLEWSVDQCEHCHIEVSIKMSLLNTKSNKYFKVTVGSRCEEFEINDTEVKMTCLVKRGSAVSVTMTFISYGFVHVQIDKWQVQPIEVKPKIHFVSFYTEGTPHDLCTNMTQAKQEYENRISSYVDTVNFYTPRVLNKNDETSKYVQPFSTNANPYNPGVHHIGFLRWKPYIILEILRAVDDGDIVYYRDGNVFKYPAILDGVEQTRELLNFVLKSNNTDIFVPVENHPYLKMKKNVKREIFEELGKFNEEYWESYGFNTSIVVCKKSDMSIKIIEEWLHGCMKDNLITYETTPNQHPEFGWNVQEQSILNVILKRHILQGTLPASFPMFSINMRRFTLDSITRIPRVAVLITGEMRNFDNPQLLKNNAMHLFDRLNCDLFISTWNKRGFSFNHGHYTNKEYASDIVSEEDIKKVYKNIKNLKIESYDRWFESLPNEHKYLCTKGFYNNGNDKLCPASVFPQLYKLWDANQQKIAYEKEHGIIYDIVIKFRGDMCMVECIPDEYIQNFTQMGVDSNASQKLYHLNPPNIYEPNRIYDIFFFGNSHDMNTLADSWNNISELINHPYDNSLAYVNTCRVLYIQAITNNIKVIDVKRAIGDIYRDENFDDYVNKVKNTFNDVSHHIESSITSSVLTKNVGRCLKGNMIRFMKYH